MSLCCIELRCCSLVWSIRKEVYSELHNWVSVCWPRITKNRSSSVRAHNSADNRMSKRCTMSIQHRSRMLALARQIQEAWANTLVNSFWHNKHTWFWLKSRGTEVSLQKNLDKLISYQFRNIFSNYRWFCIAEDWTKKSWSQSGKLNDPDVVVCCDDTEVIKIFFQAGLSGNDPSCGQLCK